MPRLDQREANELRPVSFVPHYQRHPLGSVLACCGNTRVICAVSLEMAVPRWMKEQNVAGGWITAEYQMLPSATSQRSEREVMRGKLSGRSAEIQRLIGRSLRAVVDLAKLPGMTLHVDCDVLDADGGTRTACITGAYVALCECIGRMRGEGLVTQSPLSDGIAAVSGGIVDENVVLDLDYSEDSRASADINVVMSHNGGIVEIQGTGEQRPFLPAELTLLLAYAREGIAQIQKIQEGVLTA